MDLSILDLLPFPLTSASYLNLNLFLYRVFMSLRTPASVGVRTRLEGILLLEKKGKELCLETPCNCIE